MFFHLFSATLRNSVLISGLVIVMMMLIESLNIESRGMIFSGLHKTKIGQVVLSAFLGSIPGCMGGFAAVSLYTHNIISFGALIAMMIASSGDEAFMIIAMTPDKALKIFSILFCVAIISGIVIDFICDRLRKYTPATEETDDLKCADGYVIHEENDRKRTFSWLRVWLFLGVTVFIGALASGILDHNHVVGTHSTGTETSFTLNLLDEKWMQYLFALLSLIVLGCIIFASDHFVREHLWHHIVRKHLLGIFAWTFVVLFLISVGFHYIDISEWISGNTSLMILLAAAIGIIPESGPHLIFVTLYAGGLVPLPVMLASCVSQDGHATLPLLAESKMSFLKAKLINFLVAILIGYVCLLFK